MSAPLAYIILGTPGSGRREVLADLIANGLEATDRPVMLTSVSEAAADEAVQARLGALGSLVSGTWSMATESRLAAEVPEGATHVFIVTDGRKSPIDQIEFVHEWLPSVGAELARVFTVVDCTLASAHAKLQAWYDACVHFSDVVLLNRREGVPNKWISDFTTRYRKQHFPCIIEFVKKGEVENPPRILEPEARRMSMYFDSDDAWSLLAGADTVIEDEVDDDEDDAKLPSARDVDDPDLIGEPDPYISRLAGSGRRTKEIPDIAKFLGA